MSLHSGEHVAARFAQYLCALQQLADEVEGNLPLLSGDTEVVAVRKNLARALERVRALEAAP